MTAVLEGALSSIVGMKKIESVSRYGGGSITVSFEEGDLQRKRMAILTAIRRVRDQLPVSSSFPTIELGTKQNTKQPLLVYSLTSSLPTNEIVEYTRQQLLPKIGLNPGIKSLELSTDSRPFIELTYDIAKLQALGITQDMIFSCLAVSIFHDQLGTFTSHGKTKSLIVSNDMHDLGDLLDIQVTEKIRLGDIMNAKMSTMRPSYISRLDGKNSILIRIFTHEHENNPRLASLLRSELELTQRKLPPHMQMKLSYDDTEFITKELNKISKRAGLSIGILSLLVLLVYRRWKQLVVLMGSVLVTLGLSSLLMYLFSVPVHLYTIAGLTISFGLVIDNSIMVIDHWRRKKDLKVIIALLAATLTTIAALLVILVLPKEERVGMSDFAMAISIALSASVLVSLTFTPAISKLIGGGSQEGVSRYYLKRRWVKIQSGYYRFVFFLASYKKLVFVVMILSFGFPVYLIPKTIEGFSLYNQTIGSDYYQENIRPFSDKILGGMLRSFYLNVFESSGYRTPEKTRLYVSASLDEGHTINQMDEIIRKVEEYLADVEGLATYQTTVYSGKYSQVVIEFNEETENGSLPYILKNRLIQRSLDWGGVDWNVYGVGRGFSNASGESLPSFRVKLMGYNYYDLELLADSLAHRLMVHPRIKEVNTNDRISWRDVNTEQLTLFPKNEALGHPYLTSLAYASNVATRLSPDTYVTIGNSRFPVNLVEETSETFGIYRLLNEGKERLSNNVTLERELKTNALYREGRQYVRVLSFDYYGSYRFGDEYLKKVLSDYVFPIGYTYDWLEFNWGADKVKRQYALILLILVLIFVICTATFENLKLPFYIILIIPLSFIGVFITFSWGGYYFDQGGYAAFILLAGIVVNATIFILNESRNYTSIHKNHNLIKACTRKFLPIMLTIVSTCLGLVPFLVDGQKEVFWFSFSVGVIGGLLFSILLVFVVFPVLLVKKT